jgi:hypothetical protein
VREPKLELRIKCRRWACGKMAARRKDKEDDIRKDVFEETCSISRSTGVARPDSPIPASV